MKKYIVLFSAMLLLSSCAKEIEANGGKTIERTLIASYDSVTKTSLENGCRVNWVQNDIIRYYSTNNGQVKTYKVPNSGHSTPLNVEIAEYDSFIVAVYGGKISNPLGKSMTLTDVVKPEQSGKFEDAHLSLCKHYFSNGDNMTFRNVTSLISFSLKRSDIKYVEFLTSDRTQIHGKGTLNISFDGEDYSVTYGNTEAADKNYSIKVNTDGPGTFYISTLPCSFKGFEIRCYDKDANCIGIVKTDRTLNLKEESIVDLGELDSKLEKFTVDLSSSGTANCYIASVPGQLYKFRATVKGNSTEVISNPNKAAVLWESFGTDVTPNVGDVIRNVQLKDCDIYFIPEKDGNALIAIYDMDGDLVWSWHIWVCKDYEPEATSQVYNNQAGTMMDRNLGATSATPGDVRALGLLYQWGRKDPFLSGQSISSSATAASTLSWPSSVKSNSTNGNIAYAIAHPTTFITNNSSNYDWYYTGSSATDNTRWQTSDKTKGIYDPCPVGYRVPDGGTNTTTQPYAVWSKAFGSSSYYSSGPWDGTNKGMNFGSGNGQSSSHQLGSASTIWYPAAGYRLDYADGSPCDVGNRGYYWSCTPNAYIASLLGFRDDGYVLPLGGSTRAGGKSVRCLSESK